MPTKPYKITVAIATYNREVFLKGLFKSIIDQTLNKDKFEVLLINNNSTDGTEQLCKQFVLEHREYHIRYIVETRQGLSYGRNRGVEEAQGEYITFADDDALMQSDFLMKCVEYMDKYPHIAEVGGPIYLKYIETIPCWRSKYIESLFGYFNPSDKPFEIESKSTCYPRGSNMTFRTDLLKEIRGFDISLGRNKDNLGGGEEKEVAHRLIDKGYKLAYDPSLVVFHLVPKQRTELAFIRRQALGIGISERIRSKNENSFLNRSIIEIIKWGATFFLSLYYLLSLNPTKGWMLFVLRYNITKGLFNL